MQFVTNNVQSLIGSEHYYLSVNRRYFKSLSMAVQFILEVLQYAKRILNAHYILLAGLLKPSDFVKCNAPCVYYKIYNMQIFD